MQHTGNLKVTTPSDREIRMTRVFDAPRELVFEALDQARALEAMVPGPAGLVPRDL